MTDQIRPLDNPVLLAQIGAPHGVRGEVRVKPFTDDPLAIGDYGPLYTADGRALEIAKMRPSKTVLIVSFKGFTTREAAEQLNRVELFVDRAALPNDTEEDEYYVTDLIGCDAVDANGDLIGRIQAVPDFGAGPLLEIAPVQPGGGFSRKTWFLDFTSENVPQVDLEARRVVIVPPEEVSERDPD